jgi:UDP-3-O-[3-hydroxymyristoyl] glucosamine N-acyltransferase
MRVRELCSHIEEQCSVIGLNRHVDLHFVPIDARSERGITFCDHPNVSEALTKRPLDTLDVIPPGVPNPGGCIDKISRSRIPVVIGPRAVGNAPFADKTLILVDNPRLTFMNLVAHFHQEMAQIHPTAVIGKCVTLGEDVSIGACSVIGSAGFGVSRMRDGQLRQFPQIGGVIIEDGVTIKANVCVDRGALGDTVIGEGSRIDNLCHIAHNCKIGRNVSIVASSMIAGSVTIGDNSWIAPNASILNGIKIGKNCVVGMGSVVLSDVPDGMTVKGLHK